MADYIFTIPYDRRGNAVGQYTSDPLPPIDPKTGIPKFNDGDTISFQYTFINHGISEGPNSAVVSNSIINATPANTNGEGPFPNGAYTYVLNAENNFTVTLINNTKIKDAWRLSGSFISSLTNSGVTVKWDPEVEVGTGG
ncbi:hypothetical protein ACO0LF_19605 [Undibacterium sp. Di27W]|uniref:hypothetical protein n=1 Tax=Undibacterium sp. Di27W TaxID=3413036 RepID=UPI003BF18D74